MTWYRVPRAIRSQISAAKSQLQDPDAYAKSGTNRTAPGGEAEEAGRSYFEENVADVYRLYERRLEASLSGHSVPRHVGVILDGNRRWARSVGLADVSSGHQRGADHIFELGLFWELWEFAQIIAGAAKVVHERKDGASAVEIADVEEGLSGLRE